MSSDEKDMDGGTANEEERPINSVDKSGGGGDDAETAVRQPSSRRGGGGKGCVLSRTTLLVLVIFVVLLLALVAVVAGLLGKTLFGCPGGNANGNAFPVGQPSPRPTVQPGLPWSGIRLPDSILPSYYNLSLKVDLVTFSFNGSLAIDVNVTRDTEYVIIHVNNLDIDRAAVSVVDIRSGKRHRISRHIPEPANEFYVLELTDWLQKGRQYRLGFYSFVGYILDDLRGIYKSTYKDAQGVTRYLAASQLQSVDARKVFPCFDEPHLKARFAVSLSHKNEYIALSNMPKSRSRDLSNGWVQDDFQETPLMSTYLLAFVVADFKNRSKVDNNLEVRIWAQPDMYEQTSYALDFAAEAYIFFTDYFDTPEIVPKADHVAIPDFSAGAMENWGLVLYRETALLHDEDVSSIFNKYWVSLIMAHEIAHTWFGNMVTMEWWDDLWLNEGFANTLMYFALDSIYANWKVFDLQVVNNIFPVMTKDSLLTSHAISTPINNPDDITQYFDSISYDKGMAVLRLLRGFLGWEDFRKGLQMYIKKYSLKNAEMKDLWRTFEEAVNDRYNVGEIMDTWTRQMGFPVVSITKISGTRYKLEQSRFLLNDEDDYDDEESPYQHKWHIPLIYKIQGETQERTQWMHMDSAEISIPKDSWVIGNVDYMAFFRTNYDVDMWKRLIDQLQKDHTVFSPSNRAGLISDAFNLARANKLSYEIALNLSSYLHKEDDFVPWQAFLDSVDFIKGMLSTSSSFGLFRKYIFNLVAPLYRKLGTSDKGDLLERNLRRVVFEAAADVGVPDAIEQALGAFENWMKYGTKMTPDYAVVLYAVGIQKGGEQEWDYVWNKAQNTRVASEAENMMNALAFTQEPWLLWRYARWSLDNTKIRMQDVRNLFRYFASTPLGRAVALQFQLTDWDEINNRWGMDAYLLRDVIYATTSLINTEYEYKQLGRLYRESPPSGFASKAAENSLALIRSNINWMKLNHDTIHNWLKSHAPTE